MLRRIIHTKDARVLTTSTFLKVLKEKAGAKETRLNEQQKGKGSIC